MIDEPLGFEPDDNEPAEAQEQLRRRPYCNRHNCLMVATGSTPSATSYRCPVNGCQTEPRKIPRPQTKAPHSPQLCPRCSQGDQLQACEVDDKHSNQSQLAMLCSICGWSVKVPRPDIHYRRKRFGRRRDILER